MTSNSDAESPYAEFAAEPPGIAEWEELLVRFELGPRIASTAFEEIPRQRWNDSVSPDRLSPREHLAHLAEREVEVEAALRSLQSGEWLGDPAPGANVAMEADAALTEYTRLRGRNFGALQRRGVDVWEWAAPHPAWGTVTVYQLVSATVRHDGLHIRGIRGAC